MSKKCDACNVEERITGDSLLCIYFPPDIYVWVCWYCAPKITAISKKVVERVNGHRVSQ